MVLDSTFTPTLSCLSLERFSQALGSGKFEEGYYLSPEVDVERN